MPGSFGAGAFKPTGSAAADILFKKLFAEVNDIRAVSQRASATLKFYPFGKDVDLYLEYDKASESLVTYISGVKKMGLNE